MDMTGIRKKGKDSEINGIKHDLGNRWFFCKNIVYLKPQIINTTPTWLEIGGTRTCKQKRRKKEIDTAGFPL